MGSLWLPIADIGGETMSIKKQLVGAYIAFVLLPMILSITIIAFLNTPVLHRIEGGSLELDRQMRAASFMPILREFQEAQTKNPEVLEDQIFLTNFLIDHQRLIHLAVSDGDQILYNEDKMGEGTTIQQNQLINERVVFRQGTRLRQVEFGYLPLGMSVSGEDIRKLIDTRIKWAFFSYVFFHMIFILYIIKLFLKPLNQLEYVAKEVAKKSYDFELDTMRPDEIGDTFRAFDAMKTAIQQYEDSQKELLANISHDLKTPLTAIKGYIEALSDGMATEPEKTSRYLNIMGNNVEHLEKLVEDLFLHSKLNVDQVAFDFQMTSIADYLDYLVEEIQLELEEKSVEVIWENKSVETAYAEIDAFKIRRVIWNIVDNAVKHMDKDIKRLKLTLESDESAVIVRICDNGKGISQADVQQIFDRFYRADNSRNTSIGGSGLGLSICKQIVLKHSGEIYARSQMGEMTEITIRLPRCYPLGNKKV